MPIGIVCALPQELAHLRDDMTGAALVEHAGAAHVTGRLDGHEVVLVGSGIGKVNAARTATVLVERFGVDALVLSGVAGGLDPALAVGDVVIAERAIQHDAGMIVGGVATTYQAGHIPFFNPTDALGFRPPEALAARIRARVPELRPAPLSSAAGGTGAERRVVVGTILSGDQYVSSEETRERLHRELGGHAVEMEGAALAQVADAYALPWLLVRSLSDLAGHEAEFDFQAFLEEVSASSAEVLRALLPALEEEGATAATR